MLTRPTQKRRTCLVSVVIVMTLAGLFLASTAFAKVVRNTIDPVATVTDNGRHIVARGPIECTAGERVFLHVTVTQRTTGAVAYGRTLLSCQGDIQRWRVHAVVLDKETFEEGAATVVAVARTSALGDITDAHQWLVNITLVGE